MVPPSIRLFALGIFLSAVTLQWCYRRTCLSFKCISFLMEMLQFQPFGTPTERRMQCCQRQERRTSIFLGCSLIPIHVHSQLVVSRSLSASLFPPFLNDGRHLQWVQGVNQNFRLESLFPDVPAPRTELRSDSKCLLSI